MGGPGERFPVERRRAEPSEVAVEPHRFHGRARRESDLVRLRIMHWMELADTALKSQKTSKNRRSRH
jgi:hypothetical protein